MNEVEIKKSVREFYAARCHQPVYFTGDQSPAERRAFERFETGKVLDVCCGGGRHSFFLARRGLEVIGLDLTPELIKEANERGRRFGLEVPFMVGDATCLPFRDESFDYVICIGSLMCLPTTLQRKQALMEMTRVLKVGGRLFADSSHLYYPGKYGLRLLALFSLFMVKLPQIVWQKLMRKQKIGLSFGDVCTRSDERSPFLHHFTKSELREAMKATGMKYEVFTGEEFLGEVGGIRAKLSYDLVIVAEKHLKQDSSKSEGQ